MSLLQETRKNLSKEFIVEHLDGKPMYFSGVIGGFVNGLKIRDYRIIQWFAKRGEFKWITFKEDQQFLFQKILEFHLKDKNYWKNETKEWLKKKEAVAQNYYCLWEKNLQELSEEEVVADLEKTFAVQLEARKISSLIDGFYFCGGERLLQLLDGFLKDKNKLNEIFTILTTHEDESYLIRLKKELKKISSLTTEKEKKEKIKQHLQKYSWIKAVSFAGGKEYSYEDVIEELEELKNYREKNLEENKKRRKELIEKYKFNKEIIALSDLTILFTHWQDLRKENTLMSTTLATKYVKEMARKRNIDANILNYLYFPELKNFVRGKINLEEIKWRKEGTYFIFSQDKFEVYKPEEVKDILDKILKRDVKKVKELKGMCASRGNVKGKVKIVKNVNELNKVNKGDVLVMATTRPEHLPAMKRAAAIVTDEGGVTCHASIISRELGIPCIIGTRIASQVLKDGDMVEVDAEKGVVRIIENKH